MLKSAPVRSGKISSWLGHVVAAAAWALALALLSPMARAQDLKLEAIDVQRPTLEDIYLEITGGEEGED